MVPLRRAVQYANSSCAVSARPLLCEPKPQQRKKAAVQVKQRQSAQYRTPQSTASKVYSSARNKAGSSVYGPSHSAQTKIRTVQQRKAAATAYNARVQKAAAERSEKSMRYRIKARKAGVKKMKRQQAAKLAGKTFAD